MVSLEAERPIRELQKESDQGSVCGDGEVKMDSRDI